MLLIRCPNCGDRDESEFDPGGRAIHYPELNSPAHDWHRVLHLRENPLGEIEEFWYHASGCECWIRITRNLVTHEISAAPAEISEASR